VGVHVWLERAGKPVLGKGRLELLEGIDRWRSISAAARQMGMSYRRAWLLVQSMNEAAGEPLVEAAVGGSHGGGARLTPLGRQTAALFRNVQQQLTQMAASALPLHDIASSATCVHLAAAVSLEEVLGQLLADFALREPAVRVRAVFGASDELADHVLGGAPTDLFLAADTTQLDRLESSGLLDPDSRTPLVENSLAIIGPVDRNLSVRKPADLLRSELTRIALARPACPLGSYTRTYLEGLHLYETLLPRAILVDNSRAVVAAIHAGQADAGMVYGSDAATVTGCQVLYRARRSAISIRYAAAVVCRGQQADHARALLHFLASPEAARRFRRCGFLPIRGD
jgi:molybdenum ABC transporter molybdate-binding protein